MQTAHTPSKAPPSNNATPSSKQEELSVQTTQSPDSNEELYTKAQLKEYNADDLMELSLKSAVFSDQDLLLNRQRRPFFNTKEAIDQEAFDHKYGFRRVNLSIAWRAAFYYRQVLKWKRSDWLSFFSNRMPITRWLPGYKWTKDLRNDVISGLLITIICVPQGLAYGYLVGVPPVYGLITGIVGPLVYAMFGSSKHASPGAFAIVSLMVGAVVNEFAAAGKDNCKCANGTYDEKPPVFCCRLYKLQVKEEDAIDVSMTVTLLVGILQILFGLLNAGILSVWLSDHLVQGLMSGAAIHVLTSQLSAMTGIEGLPRTAKRFGVIEFYICFFSHIHTANVSCVVTSLISVFCLLFASYVIDPIIKKWTAIKFPMEFLLVVFSILIVYLADGTKYHIELPIVGYVKGGMKAPRLPAMKNVEKMLSPAAMIAIISLVIHLAMAKLVSKKLNYEIDANQEWLALGLMHTVTSFFGGFAGGSSLGRTMMQVKFGAKTQLSTIVTCCTLVVFVYGTAACIYHLPKAVLASIVVVALKSLFVQLFHVFKIWRQSIVDFMIFLVTFFSVVLLNVEEGLIIGITFALLTVVFRTQWAGSTRMGRIPGSADFKGLGHYKMAQEIPGVKVFRFDAPLYFANAELFINRVYRACGINPLLVKAKVVDRQAAINKRKKKKANAKQRDNLTAESGTHDPEEVLPLNKATKNSDSESRDENGSSGDWEAHLDDYAQHENIQVTHLILDFSSIPFIDLMGLDAVAAVYEDYKSIDIQVMLAQTKISVRQLFEATSFMNKVPKNRMFVSLNDAVTQAVKEQQAPYQLTSIEDVRVAASSPHGQAPVANEPQAKSVTLKTTPFDENETLDQLGQPLEKRTQDSSKRRSKPLLPIEQTQRNELEKNN